MSPLSDRELALAQQHGVAIVAQHDPGYPGALQMGFNLMGRSGFFDRFLMTFNDRARTLTVSRLARARR